MTVLSKAAKEAKHKFLRKNPHLHDNHSPTSLDEHLELIEEYLKATDTGRKIREYLDAAFAAKKPGKKKT